MFRVLTIIAAVVALAVTATPASAASKVLQGTRTFGSADDQIYLDIKLENVQITNYQIG
jgi:hypothetical protein